VIGPDAWRDRLAADSSRLLAMLTSTMAASGAVTAATATTTPTAIQN